MDKYKNIYKHYEKCLEENGDSHLGVDWPNYDDMIRRYKIMLNILKYSNKNQNSSILDFGAGCGGMYDFIKSNNYNLNYTALDISQKFCNTIKKKFNDIDVLNIDILKQEINSNYDFIILNGVFTEKRDLNDTEMWDFFTNILKKLWKNTNIGISFNVMTPIVDWKDDKLFYLSYDILGKFLKENLSRNYIFNQSYGLWEYTVYVFKDSH
uniref:Methyltransferase type 12 domain-containing protein n=1 Tax=viral metagenome TaxID=1070528 RepID=A0A6C0M1G4_9ZZZZ